MFGLTNCDVIFKTTALKNQYCLLCGHMKGVYFHDWVQVRARSYRSSERKCDFFNKLKQEII